MRSGDLTEKQTEKIKTALTGAKVAKTKRLAGGALVLTENPNKGKVQFRVVKEGGKIVITDMKIM